MISENESAIGSSPALLMKCNGRRQTNATHSRFTMMRLLALLLAMIIPSLTQAAMGPEELKALGLNDPCAAVDVRTRQGLPAFNLPYPLPARVLPAPNDKLVRILPVKPEPAGNPQAAPYGSPVWEYQQFVEWREKEKWVMARLQHEMHVNQHEEETHRLVLECAKRNPCLGSELFARRGPTTLKITMPTERELPRTLLNSHGVVDGNRPANAIRTIQWEWSKYHQGTLIYQQGFTPTLAQMKKTCAASPSAGATPVAAPQPPPPSAAPQAWVDPCEELRREVKKHKYNLSLRKKLSKCEKEHRAPVQVTPPLQIVTPPAPVTQTPGAPPTSVPIEIPRMPGVQPTPAPGPTPPTRALPAPNTQAIAQCRDQYLRLRADTLQLVHSIRASTQPFENWSRLLNSIEGRVNQAGRNLQHAGLTMDSCHAIAEQIYGQHIMLTWLQSHGPRRLPNPHTIAECRAQNTWLLDKTKQLIPQLRGTGRVTGYELQALNGQEQQLIKLRQDLWRDGLNMPSCNAIGEQTASALQNLAEIAARPRTIR